MGPSLSILSPHYVFLLRESRESFGIASTLFSKLVTSREIVLNVLFPIKPGSTGCSLCFSIDFFSVNCLDFSPTLRTSAIRKLKVGRIYRDCRHSQSITPAVFAHVLVTLIPSFTRNQSNTSLAKSFTTNTFSLLIFYLPPARNDREVVLPELFSRRSTFERGKLYFPSLYHNIDLSSSYDLYSHSRSIT